MSVLMEFSIFPIDGGESKSEYVGKVLDMIDKSGFEYKLTPMGTVVETDEISDALSLVQRSYEVLEPYSKRVYSTVKLDIRKDKKNALKAKINSVEKAIGRQIKS